jgi:hypothetical protein
VSAVLITRVAVAVLCGGAAIFFMRVLAALVKEVSSRSRSANKVYFAKFNPSSRKRGELIEMKPEILKRKLPIQAGRHIAIAVLIMACLVLPAYSQQSSEGAVNNAPSANNQQPNDPQTGNGEKSSTEPARRALPAPLDGIFPSSDYFGPTPLIGVPDTDPVWPLTKALWEEFPGMKKHKIKVYGWLNPGISISSSDHSNIPESYAIVPDKIEMDQAVLRFERVPDTIQTDHVDWGFRFTTIYGIDYRWTTAQGWFSEQLLKRNSLYGADPVETYALVYFPHVAQGMVLKIGRYISPPDIEAQLSPDNFLFTHSLMFTVDCYTQTGINAAIKLNDQYSVLFGIHAGDDIAPWNAAAHPTAMAMLRWVSKSNNDSLWGGIDSLNNGKFKAVTTICSSSISPIPVASTKKGHS